MFWLVSSVLAGEVLLFLVLMVADRGHPRKIGCGWFYFALCLGLFTMAGTSFWAYRDTLHRIKDLDAIQARQVALTGLMRGILEMESGRRGYLLTGQDVYREHYVRDRTLAIGKAHAVRAAYQGSSDTGRVDNLLRMLRLKVEEMDKTLAASEQGRPSEGVEAVQEGAGKNLMELARGASDDLERRNHAADTESRKQLRVVAQSRILMALIVACGAIAQMCLGAVFGWPADRERVCAS